VHTTPPVLLLLARLTSRADPLQWAPHSCPEGTTTPIRQDSEIAVIASRLSCTHFSHER
jgi:hypothetical protein